MCTDTGIMTGRLAVMRYWKKSRGRIVIRLGSRGGEATFPRNLGSSSGIDVLV